MMLEQGDGDGVTVRLLSKTDQVGRPDGLLWVIKRTVVDGGTQVDAGVFIE